MRQRWEIVLRHALLRALGSSPSKTQPGYEVEKWRYVRRYFIRVLLPMTLVACGVSMASSPPVVWPFSIGLMVVWGLFMVSITRRIRKARAARALPAQSL
jgi:hypothetical protein